MHAKHLCQMPQVNKGDASLLHQLNHVSSHMNALQALSLNVPVQDLMLNHLMLATVDSETQREWELNTASRANTPTTAELFTFLETRCKAFELLQNVQTSSMFIATPRSLQSAGVKVSKPVYCNVAIQLQCTLCSGSHRLFKYDRFLKMQLKQLLSVPNNRDCASVVCTNFSRTTHVQSKCVINVIRDIIPCYT